MPSSPAVVSVMMPVYNAERYVARAVESVLAQSFSDFELVIIDDGSQDQSRTILERYARTDSRIRLYSRPNAGVGATRNELLNLTRGELLAVNDADDISVPNRLESQVRYFRDHPECVALGGRMLLVDPEGTSVCEQCLLTTHEEIDFHHLTRGGAMGHSTIMMRAEAVRSVGGYRPSFAPSEDFDLLLRLSEVGKLANLPQVLTTYRLHDASLSHAQAGRQAETANTALAEARARRGIAGGVRIMNQSWHSRIIQRLRARWALMAWDCECYSSSRALAKKALAAAPLAIDSWMVCGVALLGPTAKWMQKQLRSTTNASKP